MVSPDMIAASRVKMDAYVKALLSHPFQTPGGERRKTTESFLEILSAAFMESHTVEDPLSYDILRYHIAPDFSMVSMTLHECSVPSAESLEEHLANVRALKRVNPAWVVGGYNFTARMEENEKHVIVWFTSRGVGGPSGWSTNRESVSRLYWRKRRTDGVWECYKHACIRGPGNIIGQMDEFT